MTIAKPSVLIVDDVEANLIALEAHLGKLDCQLVRAKSGNDALRQLLQREFAVMLLDVQMPEMNGYEVARYARENPTTRDVPIIFVTAMDQTEENLLQGYGTGAVDYLFKPINPHILRSKVQVFLDLYLSRERKRVIEALEESLQVRDEFLMVASHELRTPVAALQLYQHAMLRDLGKLSLDAPGLRLTARLEKAIGQTARLGRLVEDLLDVSQIVMGRLSLELKDVDLREVVTSVIGKFEPTLASAGCKVAVRSEPAVSGHWDRSRLEQVISNLLSNAAKFASNKPVEITISKRQDAAVVTVEDQGIGMSPEDQKRVFDRFERGVSWRNFGGLGLGLYISRRVIEAHGGLISVTSQLGIGSVFTVQLPMNPMLPVDYSRMTRA